MVELVNANDAAGNNGGFGPDCMVLAAAAEAGGGRAWSSSSSSPSPSMSVSSSPPFSAFMCRFVLNVCTNSAAAVTPGDPIVPNVGGAAEVGIGDETSSVPPVEVGSPFKDGSDSDAAAAAAAAAAAVFVRDERRVMMVTLYGLDRLVSSGRLGWLIGWFQPNERTSEQLNKNKKEKAKKEQRAEESRGKFGGRQIPMRSYQSSRLHQTIE